jgi:hypothetical protein
MNFSGVSFYDESASKGNRVPDCRNKISMVDVGDVSLLGCLEMLV